MMQISKTVIANSKYKKAERAYDYFGRDYWQEILLLILLHISNAKSDNIKTLTHKM